MRKLVNVFLVVAILALSLVSAVASAAGEEAWDNTSISVKEVQGADSEEEGLGFSVCTSIRPSFISSTGYRTESGYVSMTDVDVDFPGRVHLNAWILKGLESGEDDEEDLNLTKEIWEYNGAYLQVGLGFWNLEHSVDYLRFLVEAGQSLSLTDRQELIVFALLENLVPIQNEEGFEGGFQCSAGAIHSWLIGRVIVPWSLETSIVFTHDSGEDGGGRAVIFQAYTKLIAQMGDYFWISAGLESSSPIWLDDEENDPRVPWRIQPFVEVSFSF